MKSDFEILINILEKLGIEVDEKINDDIMLEDDLFMDSQEIVELTEEVGNEFKISTKEIYIKRTDSLKDVVRKINCLTENYSNIIHNEIIINRDVITVRNAVWDLDKWEDILDHVSKVEILKKSNMLQSFNMSVKMSPDSELLTVESYRILVEGIIYFCQPIPPKYLRVHKGTWIFEEVPDGRTKIILSHMWEPCEYAEEIFASKDKEVIKSKIKDSLEKHAVQTLEMWKGILDGDNRGIN